MYEPFFQTIIDIIESCTKGQTDSRTAMLAISEHYNRSHRDIAEQYRSYRLKTSPHHQKLEKMIERIGKTLEEGDGPDWPEKAHHLLDQAGDLLHECKDMVPGVPVAYIGRGFSNGKPTTHLAYPDSPRDPNLTWTALYE